MVTATHKRSSPASELSSDFSDSSPRRKRPSSPPRRSPHHRERSPEHHHRGFTRNNNYPPVRSRNSYQASSPTKEKLTNHARSIKRDYSRSPRREKAPSGHMRSRSHKDSRSPVKLKHRSRNRDQSNSSPVPVRLRSPVRNETSRSPSPRTKRLRHANKDREYADKPMDLSRRSRRGHDMERQEQTADKRISTEKSNGRSSKSTIRDHSNSPSTRNDRRKYSSQSPLRSSKMQRQDERNIANDNEHHKDSEDESIAKMKATEEALEAKKKEKPSFELSGKLAEETNRVRGVTLLFNEPADACKPDIRWRLYVFKGGKVLNEPLYIHRQSCYLFGRERRVADIPTDHPSCSKQHAVIQYRSVEKEQPDGMMKKNVRPYLMDLGSTNETFINGNRVEPHRYYELFEKDTIKFGNSSREYVILHENSAP